MKPFVYHDAVSHSLGASRRKPIERRSGSYHDPNAARTMRMKNACSPATIALRKTVLMTAFLCGVTESSFAADPPAKAARLLEGGALPARVHVFEDYETEIEKRWWLRGIPVMEKKELAPGLSASVPNTRACRATDTKDFDDKQGDPSKTWKAVIFNPVPGPPMGPGTRLNFRYRLTGTDILRIQIYSLTNGYHRRYFLTKLPQAKWERADIDMTQLRRPDGSGGPLAADERIDDIQFYITPEADLLIDDIVLYEAAPPEERAPFPRRIIFTGWFDTGKQGVEWPGDFAIAPHEPPLTWKCAKSVPDAVTGAPRIRMHLRGLRPLSAANRLRFRCKLTGGGPIAISLGNSANGREWPASQVDVPGGWLEKTVEVPSDTNGAFADELRFSVPRGSELLVDDVLLFEPSD
jgi:hypothetical protein